MKSILLCISYIALFSAQCYNQSFKVVKNSEGYEVWEGNDKIFFYQEEPTYYNRDYKRSCYIHPLYGLNGEPITEDFPEDHRHHRGIFWAWHQIIIDDEKIADAWDCENVNLTLQKISWNESVDMLNINLNVLWSSEIIDGTGVYKLTYMNETTNIKVFSSMDNYRVIDFDISLEALTDHLKIGGSDNDKGYGGFSVRLKLPDDLKFHSNKGVVKPQRTAVYAGSWIDMVASFEGDSYGKSGVLLMTHPDYPGKNQGYILRAAKSMQNIAFPGREAVEIPKNGSIRLMYRMVIHDGNCSDIDGLYNDFVNGNKQ